MKKIVPLLAIIFGLPLLTTGRLSWLAVGLAGLATVAAMRGWLDADLQTHDPDVRPHYK